MKHASAPPLSVIITPMIIIASVAAVSITVLIPVVIPTTIVVAATSTTASPALVVANITTIIRLTIVCDLQHPGYQLYIRVETESRLFLLEARSNALGWVFLLSLSITNLKCQTCRKLATSGWLTFSTDYLARNIGRVE